MQSQTIRVYYENKGETPAIETLAKRFGVASTNPEGFSERGFVYEAHFDLDSGITRTAPRLFAGQVLMGIESVTRVDLAEPQERKV